MNRFVDFPYITSFVVALVAWLGGCLICLLVQSVGLISSDAKLIWTVAVGSGLTASLAGAPGALDELTHGGARSGATITFGALFGGVIRLLGTVALVALCRYQMPAEKNVAALWIIGWYCYLTIIEVAVLAYLFPFQDRLGHPKQQRNSDRQTPESVSDNSTKCDQIGFRE